MSKKNDENRLREAVVTDCLGKLDWPTLKAHLDTFVFDETTSAKIIELTMRERAMVFRYPGNSKKRTAVLDGIMAKIEADLGEEAADKARNKFKLFAIIDEGYAGLRGFISQLPLAGLPQAESFAAYLASTAREWCAIIAQIENPSAERPNAGSVVLTAADGSRFNADTAIAQLVNLLSMNVMLAGYGGKWFDETDIIRIPQLPEVTDEQIELAGSANVTALAWQQWQLIEERCRFLDGEMEKTPANDERLPADADVLWHTSESLGWEMIDTAANERLGERLSQTYQDMVLKTGILSQGQGTEPGTPMSPAAAVSPQELHSNVMLCEYLGFNISKYGRDLGGLKLIEWVRGFAVLQHVASGYIARDASPMERAFPKLLIADLEDVLRRNGLDGAKARTFIDHASFTKSSRDLYDAPIIRDDADGCWLVTAGLEGALIIRIVLSTLANKKLDIEGKGEAFEKQFRKTFSENQIPVYHFEANRPDGPYEYDAIVPWGKYLFLFECKNRSLSGANPIASFNLLRSTVEHVGQVQRLHQALIDYPDILTQYVKEDCSELIIVPVVVSSMPFSMTGELDGVYFADAAAIGRFFQERYMHISRVHQLGDVKVMHRVPTHSQWSDAAPSANDFMQNLENPLPLRIMIEHLKIEPLILQIGPKLYAATQRLCRTEMTTKSLAELAGLTEAAIEEEMDRVTREAIDPLRNKLQTSNDDEPAGAAL